MTNSQKMQILNKAGYELNQVTEMMFGQKTYHLKTTENSWNSMGSIMARNKAIIWQSELDEVNSEVELKNLIKSKQ
jgi:hypothetical protein